MDRLHQVEHGHQQRLFSDHVSTGNSHSLQSFFLWPRKIADSSKEVYRKDSGMEPYFWKAIHAMFLFETGCHSCVVYAQGLALYEDVEGKVSTQLSSRVPQKSKFEAESLQKS